MNLQIILHISDNNEKVKQFKNNSHNFNNSNLNPREPLEPNFQDNEESYGFSSANNILKSTNIWIFVFYFIIFICNNYFFLGQNSNSEQLRPLHDLTNIDYQENITNIEMSDEHTNVRMNLENLQELFNSNNFNNCSIHFHF